MLTLTPQQKKQLLAEYQHCKRDNDNATQAALAGWARDAFRIDYALNQSTISRIIKKRQAFSSQDSTLPTSVKYNRKAAALHLKKALYKWLCKINNNGVLLNDEVIKIKVQELLDQAKMHLYEDEKLFMKFSKGSLERFKKNHKLRFCRVHGEAQSADIDTIRKEISCIRDIIITFAEKDVWNIYKFGIFIGQPPI